MPIFDAPLLRRPWYLPEGHSQTIVPSLFRKLPPAAYTRERLELPDGDFIDLDWRLAGQQRSDKLVLLLHGLEGNSHRHYITGLVSLFGPAGWDALAVNLRSCSGEINRLPRFYHHGDTPDVHSAVNHALAVHAYRSVVLIGISLGGSLTLKYLGEQTTPLPAAVRGGVAISVPVDLGASEAQLRSTPANRLYIKNFLRKLGQKIKAKAEAMPDQISYAGFEQIKGFPEFDRRYTCPLHGFASPKEYYHMASSKHYLQGIGLPTLIINALNDPFLAQGCYPTAQAQSSRDLYLEMPHFGGHVGFTVHGQVHSYAELRALQFVQESVVGK